MANFTSLIASTANSLRRKVMFLAGCAVVLKISAHGCGVQAAARRYNSYQVKPGVSIMCANVQEVRRQDNPAVTGFDFARNSVNCDCVTLNPNG